MSTRSTCGRCGRPARDAFLCTECRGTLAIDLTALAAYIPELGNAVALQARTSSRPTTGRPAREDNPTSPAEPAESKILPPHLRTASGPIALRATSIGVNLDAAHLLALASNYVSTWCRHLCTANGVDFRAVLDGWIDQPRPAGAAQATAPVAGPVHLICQHDSCWQIKANTAPPPAQRAPGRPTTSDQRMLAWLIKNINTITQDPAADQIASDLHWLRGRIEDAIDNPQPRVFAGPCTEPSARSEIIDGTVYITPTVCGHPLMAETGAVKVICESCGAEYDVADRQVHMLEQMRHSLMRAPHIVDVLRAYGQDITLERLKNWIARDRAEFDEGRRRTVAYPPILLASATELDENGQPYLEQDLDAQGQPRANQHGRPIMRLAKGRPLYRLGDVQDRVVALAEIAAGRSAVKGGESA